MIKIVLCDDSQIELTALQNAVATYIKTHNNIDPLHVTSYLSSNNLLFDLEISPQNIADIYILDIDMPILNGIELAKNIRQYNPLSIIFFYTSHAEYAIQGYQVEALRYILKGKDHTLLYEALDYAIQKYSLLFKDCIVIKKQQRDHAKIPRSEIVYIQREGHLLNIYTRSLGIYKERYGINNFYDDLNDPHFIFIDRGTIINIEYVQRTAEKEVILFNGTRLPISRRYTLEVKTTIAKLWTQ